MKIPFNKLLSKKEYLIVAGFFITLLAIGYFTFFTGNYYSGNSPQILEVSEGETFAQVTDELYQRGIIPSEFNFKVAGFIYGAEKKIKAARFKIPNGLSYLDLIELLTNGPADYLRSIRINDGQTLKWLAAKVKRDLRVDSSAFINKAKDREFIKSLGLSVTTMEGYLFSKNYKIYERSDPEEVIKIFYNALQEFFVDSLKRRAEEIGFTTNEILILASIIKGETNKVEEMPRISGVYHNRLRIGMRLQADPTIQYLLPDGWRRLTYKDLEIDSPYNTYKYSGLPPTPINNPGADAILAALYPEKHNYLYFVADGSGGHNFGKNHNEHINNVKKYRQWLKTQK